MIMTSYDSSLLHFILKLGIFIAEVRAQSCMLDEQSELCMIITSLQLIMDIFSDGGFPNCHFHDITLAFIFYSFPITLLTLY